MSAPDGLRGRDLIDWRLTQLEQTVHEIREQNDSISNWLRALMGSLLLALVLLIANLMVGRH